MILAVTVNTLVKGGMAIALGNRRIAQSVGITLGSAAVLSGLSWLIV